MDCLNLPIKSFITVGHEQQAMKEKIKENAEKIKVNKTLPYLVSNVIEILDVDPQVFTFKIVFLTTLS